MRKVCPPESFFNKGLRLANQGLQVIGTARGLYEAGQTVYGGMQAAGRLASMAGPALALM